MKGEREKFLFTLQTTLAAICLLDQTDKVGMCPSGPGILNPRETREAEKLRGMKVLLGGPRPSLTSQTSLGQHLATWRPSSATEKSQRDGLAFVPITRPDQDRTVLPVWRRPAITVSEKQKSPGHWRLKWI